MRILIVREDKLGDFLLAWPALAALKITLPHLHVTALVSTYTREIAELCPWIDEVMVDTGTEMTPIQRLVATQPLTKHIRRSEFHAAISLFSTTHVGLALWLARIPYRLAPATKIAQIFYNHRLVQHRSRSEKPEFEYNLDLVRKFLSDQGIQNIPEPRPPYLVFYDGSTRSLRQSFCNQHDIDFDQRLLFIHPGHGGSAGHLSLDQYAILIQKLNSPQPFTIVLSAGPDELDLIKNLSGQIPDIPHVLYHSSEGLVRFAKHIAFADLFIAGSTGPLHIAGALDVPTVGFYTRRRSATALRWQTLNIPERRLAFSPPPQAGEEDMEAIDIKAAAAEISRRFLAAPGVVS